MADLESLRRIVENLTSKPGRYGDQYLREIAAKLPEPEPVEVQVDLGLNGIDRQFLWECGIQP